MGGSMKEERNPSEEWQRYFFLFIRLSHLHHRVVHAAVKDLGLYRGQPPLLHRLYERDGMTQSEISEELHVRPSTVSNMVSRMVEAGFVKRRADPLDQRVSRVYLTEKGQRIREQLLAVERELTWQALESLDAEQRQTLARLLNQVCDNLQELRGACA